MNPRLGRHLREDLSLLQLLIMLIEHRQYNVSLGDKNAECYCTWQVLHFILNFLEDNFRKVLDPFKYLDYIDDHLNHLESEMKKYCKIHRDISNLMFEKHRLKKDYDAIRSLYKEINQMLHFASFEKDLKQDHDCKQFTQLKYAYRQRIAQHLKLYQKSIKDFLDINTKTTTMV